MTARKIPYGFVFSGTTAFTVRDLLHHVLRSDVRFNSNYEGVGKALRVAEALKLKENASPETECALDDGDWQAMVDALKSPSPLAGMPAYPLSPAHACHPLIELVINAKKAEES